MVVSKDYGTPKEKQLITNETTPLTNVNNNNNNHNNNHNKITNNCSVKKASPLLDITNKSENKRKVVKTKKLFKNAIVNNLSDENSTSRRSKLPNGTIDTNRNINNCDPNLNSANNKSVSFRLNEDDLAIFDLFGNDKTMKHQPKTYRTKK